MIHFVEFPLLLKQMSLSDTFQIIDEVADEFLDDPPQVPPNDKHKDLDENETIKQDDVIIKYKPSNRKLISNFAPIIEHPEDDNQTQLLLEKNINNWTNGDVLYWIENICKLGQYIQIFKVKNITLLDKKKDGCSQDFVL